MQTILKIGGMSCDNCVKHVTNAILEVPGVKQVKVSLKDNTAIVIHNEDVTIDMLKVAVDDIGYEVL